MKNISKNTITRIFKKIRIVENKEINYFEKTFKELFTDPSVSEIIRLIFSLQQTERGRHLLWKLFYSITNGSEPNTIRFWSSVGSWINNNLLDDGLPCLEFGGSTRIHIPIGCKNKSRYKIYKDISFANGYDGRSIKNTEIISILKKANELAYLQIKVTDPWETDYDIARKCEIEFDIYLRGLLRKQNSEERKYNKIII